MNTFPPLKAGSALVVTQAACRFRRPQILHPLIGLPLTHLAIVAKPPLMVTKQANREAARQYSRLHHPFFGLIEQWPPYVAPVASKPFMVSQQAVQYRRPPILRPWYGRLDRFLPAPPPAARLPYIVGLVARNEAQRKAHLLPHSRITVPIIGETAIAEYFTVTADLSGNQFFYKYPYNNLQASVPPTLLDDASRGYAPGSMWVDKVGQNTYMCIRATLYGAIWVTFNVGMLFVATTSVSSTTTAETKSLVGTGCGTMTLPGNTINSGCVLRLTAKGVWTTGATAGTITFQIKMGSTVIASTGAVVPQINTSNRYLTINVLLVFRATGLSGSVFVEGDFEVPNAATPSNPIVWPIRGNSADPPAVVAVDTTIPQLIDLQSITSNAFHTITMNIVCLERLM